MVGRIPVMDVVPLVDLGRLPAKATAGESLPVSATVFREGHDQLGAEVVLVAPDGSRRAPVRMSADDVPDRYTAWVTPDVEGAWAFEVHAWSDPIATWEHDAGLKIPAGVDVELMFTEGGLLLDEVASDQTLDQHDKEVVAGASSAARDTSRPVEARLAALQAPELVAVLTAHPIRRLVTVEGPYPLYADRARALFGSWYEFFPRSEGATYDEVTGAAVSGTLRTAAERLEAVAAMGFDVIYLPPIHPIGEVNRKGPNNTLDPGPDDPGSPWAIGSSEGGHDAVHPALGTLDDFDAFVASARSLGLEVALDLALQCAPDHPWVEDHPAWFTTQADGTIAYAENPPKKYQDIYPLNFDNDPKGICKEVLRVVRHWMSHGVRIFRVDNPHTKPVAFWEWLLREVRRTDPDVLFLAEAFTRPAMMSGLGAVGFHQSYTYFTWRTAKWELEDYLREVSAETSHLVRPNFFVNTPDILHAFLQYGGPPAFKIRAVLAATGSPSWGVYAGYELFEHVAVRPGSEEYLDSEKYQIRVRDWAAAEKEGRSLAPYLTQLNAVRRAHPALQQLRHLVVHSSDDENVLVFSKQSGSRGFETGARAPSSTDGGGPDAPSSTDGAAADAPSSTDGGGPGAPSSTDGAAADAPSSTDGAAADAPSSTDGAAADAPSSTDGAGADAPSSTDGAGADAPSSTDGGDDDLVIVVVNLDPHATRETMVHLDLPALGLDWHDSLAVHDEITGQDWHWGQHNYVRLDPYDEPAHVLTVRRTS